MWIISDYCVLSAESETNLRNHVVALIKNGWEPQGGVCVIVTTSVDDCYYFQAMVRKERSY